MPTDEDMSQFIETEYMFTTMPPAEIANELDMISNELDMTRDQVEQLFRVYQARRAVSFVREW